MEIDTIINKLKIKYYKALIKSLNKSNTTYDWLNNYVEQLKTEDKHMYSDKSLYTKPWSKLNAIHKILKIKEFVENLKINSEKERTKLKDELISLVKAKVLTKKEKVKYDENNGKISSIVNLQYKDNKYFYQQD